MAKVDNNRWPYVVRCARQKAPDGLLGFGRALAKVGTRANGKGISMTKTSMALALTALLVVAGCARHDNAQGGGGGTDHGAVQQPRQGGDGTVDNGVRGSDTRDSNKVRVGPGGMTGGTGGGTMGHTDDDVNKK